MAQYGSLVNSILSGNKSTVTPEVGMGVTLCMWSDRHPYTVVKVLSNRRIVVQEDNYKRIDDNGMSECQKYEYTPNPEASEVIVTLRKNGQWKEMGGRSVFSLGFREKYHDFSF